MEYFSDREKGPRPRTEETISPLVWGGIGAVVKTLVSSGAFGFRFPETCPDGAGTAGTDENLLSLALKAEIPELDWPLKTDPMHPMPTWAGNRQEQESVVPGTLIVLDFIEFCYQSIGKPIQDSYHSFFRHYHLTFDEQEGQEEFRVNINRIFGRNGVAYQLSPSGQIERLAPLGLRELLSAPSFLSGDTSLDRMLEDARRKFLNPAVVVRQEALECLWDCWERLKTLDNQDKKVSIAKRLVSVAPEVAFRERLDKEGKELTDIGNKFHIRHKEVTQIPITIPAHLDYLFHRMFSFIQLLLHKPK